MPTKSGHLCGVGKEGRGKEVSLFCFHPFSIMTIALITKTKYRIRSDIFKYSIII